jgi:beta-lactamase superfamily II metal-dependent hydrolase
MRKIILSILLLVSLRLATYGQEVKIIHLGVGHGDATLIVIKDCTDNTDDAKCMSTMRQVNIVIDASDRGDKKMFRAIKKELDPTGKSYHIDFLIISHLDTDHYAGAAGVLDGVRADAKKARDTAARREQMAVTLEKEAAETTREDVKQRRLEEARRLREEARALRASVAWVDTMIIYDRKSLHDTPSTDKKWMLPIPVTTMRGGASSRPIRNAWLIYTDAREPFEKAKTQTPLLSVGKNILDNYQLKHVEMVCIASNGAIGKKEGEKLVVDERAQPSAPGSTTVRSENDLSSAFLLRFGSFRYYTAGDLSGVEKEESKTLYTNIETPLAEWVKDRWDNKYPGEDFHVCAAKISHHGSNSATNDDFIRVFNPRLAVISAANNDFNRGGQGGRKILPKKELIRKLLGNKDFPITDNMRARPVLFTYGYDQSLDPMVEPYENWLKPDKKYAEPDAHDVILLVKKESDGTPLVAGKPPQMHIFSRKRNRENLTAVDTTATPFVLKPEGVGADKNIYSCDKNAAHKPLVLPAFGPAAPSSP